MIPNKDIWILIPSFNEGKVLRETLRPLIQSNYSIVLIDDGSQDNTVRYVKDLPIHCLIHAVNLGQGAALQTGMEYAKNCGAKFVIHFDADGQHDPNDIPNMLEPIMHGEADIVFGDRFLGKKKVPWRRALLIKMGILFNGVLTGIWLSDAHNGLRALNKLALEKIHLQENGMSHASEILIECRLHKLRIREVPVTIHYSPYARQKGQSMWNAFHIANRLVLRKIFS